MDELKNVDLLSPDCPIRYIITVNALKEGWDCPFTSVLATVANRSSVVDVEKILGRILRLPDTQFNSSDVLSLSYVITSMPSLRLCDAHPLQRHHFQKALRHQLHQ